MKTATLSQVTYNTFIEQLTAQKIQRVTLKPDRIEYSLKPEFGFKRFYTIKPAGNTDDLPAMLRSHNIGFTTIGDTSGQVASLIGLLLSSGALMGAFAWLLKDNPGGMGGVMGDVMGTGKSKARACDFK